MTDIVQKGLNLQVAGEDVGAGDLFNALSDQLVALEAKAQDVFGSIGLAGEDAMSVLADSANGFLPVWDEQLQAISEAAGGIFAALEASAASAASGVAESASGIAPAWQAASDKLSAALETAAGSVSSSTEKIEGDLGSIDSKLSSLATSADGAKAGIQTALDEAAGAVSTNGSKIVSDLSDTAAGVSTQVDKITGDLSDIKTGASGINTAADGMPAAFSSSLDKVSSSVATGAGKIVGDLDKITTAAKDAGLALRLDGSTATATGGKGKAGAAGSGGALLAGGAGGKAAAAEEESLVDRWLPKVSAVKTRVAAIGEEIKGLEEKMSGVGNKLVTGGIVASMIPFGAESSANFIEGLTTTSKQTGLGMSKAYTLQDALVALGVKNPSQAIAMIARMENRLHSGTSEVVGPSASSVTGKLNQPGNPKGGINPSSIGVGVPNVDLERVLAPYGLNANTLFHLSALDQLTAISKAINQHPDKGVWANRATSLIQTLFGGRGGGGGGGTASMQLVLRDWAEGLSAAQKTPNPITDLGLPSNPLKAAVGARAIGYSVEAGMLTVLTRLLPVLEKFTTGLETFTKEVMHPSLGNTKSLLSNPWADLIGLWAGSKGVKGAAGLAKSLAKIFGKGGAAGAAESGGEAALTAGGVDLAGLGASLLSKAAGPLGIAASQLIFPDSLSHSESGAGADAWAKMWQTLVAPHTDQKKFSEKDVETALAEAAKVFGLNEKAILADAFAESGLNPGAVNKKSGATGIFQFMPQTWAADTKKFLGQSIPFSAASNPFIAAFIGAASMAKGGIGSNKTGERNALAQMLAQFENPGGDLKNPKTPLGGDWTRGTSFLTQLDADLDKANTSAKTKTPQLTKTIDSELQKLVLDAQKHGKEFSKTTDQALLDAETYLRGHTGPLTKTGQDLMKGLYTGMAKEEPTLLGEAKKIAAELEQTIRAALKTHSPSELTAEIGSDLMAGLALGIQRSTGATAATAAAEASKVAGALAGAPAAGSAAGPPQTIIIELDGRTLVQYVLRETHDLTKLVAKFN